MADGTSVIIKDINQINDISNTFLHINDRSNNDEIIINNGNFTSGNSRHGIHITSDFDSHDTSVFINNSIFSNLNESGIKWDSNEITQTIDSQTYTLDYGLNMNVTYCIFKITAMIGEFGSSNNSVSNILFENNEFINYTTQYGNDYLFYFSTNKWYNLDNLNSFIYSIGPSNLYITSMILENNNIF